MRNALLLALIASFTLVACDKAADKAEVPVADARQPWDEFVATVIDDY